MGCQGTRLDRSGNVLVCLALGVAAGCGGGSDAPPGSGADAGADVPPDAPAPPPALCDPAPHWLTEGETIEIDLLCPSEGDEVSGEDVVLAPLPAGATYDSASARLTWTPALDQAAVYEIAAEIPARGDSATITIGVADDWEHPDNVPIVDPEAYPMEYGVPVFFLSPAPEQIEDYESAVIVHGGRTYYAEAKRRGRSSLDYPKSSYTLEFPASARFSEPAIDGFSDKHKVVLASTFDDNSYLRQHLAFELWNRLDPGHIQIQSYPAVVYLEDRFWGLYTVIDHVDDDLLAQQGLGGFGNLYKAVSHDANFLLTRHPDGPRKETLHEGYEKKSGLSEDLPGAYDDIEELVRFAVETDDATFAAEIGARVDLRDYIDWLILVTFIAGDDNAGKNTYHYHRLDGPDPDSPWRMVPWDFNATFGQDWQTRRQSAEYLDYYESRNRLFERFLAIPALSEQVAARYREALDSALSVAEIEALIDGALDRIGPVAARDRARWRAEYESFERWSDRTDFTSHAEEIDYLRAWIAERWALLDAAY